MMFIAGAVLALFCAVTLAGAEINENGCPVNPYVDVLKPHPNCNKFYQCLQGELLERNCASNLVFNVELQACDYSENVDCENQLPEVPETSEETKESEDSANNGNDDPSLAPEICAAEDSDSILVAHESCNKFYECHNGVPVARRCAATLVFNPKIDACDWPENVDCGNRVPGDNGNGDGGDNGNGEGNVDSEDEEDHNGSEGDSGDNESNEGAGNGDPSEASQICSAEDSNGVLVAHENCNQFYKCSEGKPVALECPLNLLFNPSNEQCDWPENVNCDGRNPDGGNGGNGDGGNGDNGDNGNGDGNGDSEDEGDNNGGEGDSGNGDNESNGGTGNGDPSEASQICSAEDSDGVLVAHENCNQFYKCSEGKPVALDCPLNLLYNPSNEQCDWPENVNCDGRNPDGGNGGNGDGGSGDNGNNENNAGGGNANPSEAPEICAAEDSDGVLVAHENCNQFYKCSEGKPVALDCPLNLLYNPSNEQCDWPENVNCDGRNPDGGNNWKIAGGRNANPSEAPEICAAENSDGVLVAHENCNQFYKCSEGKPEVLDCQLNLLYNPSNEQCDWPENVNCDGRNPDSGNGSNGDSGNGDNGDNGNNGGGGNTNPSEAPEICAAEDSDGVLVAHENCNQFYKCSEGKPAVLDCPLNLVFNPSNDSCDWPENVNCGNRNKFTCFNKFTSFNKHMRLRA